MEGNRISVIIILYFSKHLISKILLNVREKIEGLGEIILVNNSRENIDEYMSDDVSIIYPECNLGYGAAINLGVKKSIFPLLLILNPDLYIEHFDASIPMRYKNSIISGYIPNMPGYAYKFPSLLDTFIANALTELLNLKSLEKIIHYQKIKSDLEEVKVDYISGALIFMSKMVFKKVGGFDDKFFLYYEETDFCKRAALLNIPVFNTGKIIYNPNKEKASSTDVTHIKIESGIRSSKIYHNKHNGAYSTKIVFGILKLYYQSVIILLTPISFVSNKVKIKINNLVYRLKFI